MFPVVCEKSIPFPAVKSKIKNQKSKIKNQKSKIKNQKSKIINKIFFQSDFPVQLPRFQKLKLKELSA